MPVVVSLTKVAALAIAFICIGIGTPPIDQGMVAAEAGASSPRLHCRLYFGCAPCARNVAGGLTTEWREFDVFTP